MTMRPIVPYAGKAIAAASGFGPVPELRWLTIADLRVDEAYQRPITVQGWITIKNIVANFDWRMFAPVVVCPVAGGMFAIVDGQHRTTAALTCGIETVPCLIIQADMPTQAKAFDAINGRVTRMSPTSFYKARLAAGDETALRIRSVTERAGVRLLTYNPSWKNLKPNETTAFNALRVALLACGDEVLCSCLRALIVSAAGTSGMISTLTIGAFTNVLLDHAPWLDHPRFIEIAADFHLEEQIEVATLDAARKRTSRQPFLEAALVTHFGCSIEDRKIRMASPAMSQSAQERRT